MIVQADATGAVLVRDVAALFVDRKGDYPKHVAEWWDEKRDATSYDLELPVVAHPPCQRWCRLAGLVEARWGIKRGEDGGLFASALATVRRVGGVLEHPAYSDAWKAYGLPHPPTGGEWIEGAQDFEWTCYVEQWRYGHRAKKATWLYYVGLTPPLPMRWGHLQDKAAAAAGCAAWRDSARRYVSPTSGRVYGPVAQNWQEALDGYPLPTHVVGHMKADGKGNGSKNPRRLSKGEAIHTPAEFREALIALARHSQLEPIA